jgi:intracellular sulfur oxidation DsrE/DsrF family protein
MSASPVDLPRRSFFNRLGAAAAAFGTALAARDAAAQSAPPPPSPAGRAAAPRHTVDDWLDQSTGTHRLFFDTTTVEGFGHAVFWANNFLNASRNGYSLADSDSSIVIGVRHHSAAFALNDAMWAKYGAALSTRAEFLDPKSKAAPTRNVFLASDYGSALTNTGTTIDAVTRRGVRLAVCTLATRANASAIAQRTGGKTDDIMKELLDNLVANAVMVPAGIVALSRAQERGYTFTYAE